MKELLVATDLSPRSDRALERAAELSRRFGARLGVLHVVESESQSAALDRRRAESEDAIRAHLAARAPDVDAQVAVVQGEAFAEIQSHADARGVDLVILGAHREGATRDMFAGSTAWRVLREASRPVLLVKEPCLRPYERLAVGVDFSPCSAAALRLALRFDPREMFAVHAYHVPFSGFIRGGAAQRDVRSQHEAETRRFVADALADADMPTDLAVVPKLRDGTALDVIRQAADELKPDLLAIGTHGRAGLAHMVFGSVAEDLLRAPPCDVVAVRAA